ncbi:hypothetical protein BB558_001019 [Smittium angustum]|uniref:Uncharacterized protein n=1 Tax=Smittium angustum TaxID=133377 RepID=A0A2U1JCX1_SMIAN|nr:hypothetical protein BB558_001019 [Smittium angustum]
MKLDISEEFVDYPEKVVSTTSDPDNHQMEVKQRHHGKHHKKDDKRAKRFAYLLSQTDIFSHFLKDFIKDEELKKEIDAHMQIMRTKKVPETKSRRHRRTEKEEDIELLDSEKITTPVQLVFTETPHYIATGSMRDYQLRGLNWMISLYENGLNGILADEMGLGKTLQVISFLGYLKYYRGSKGPNLVVVPKTTMHNWKNEFERWLPTVKPVLLLGDKEQRKKIIEENFNSGMECLVTTYEMCLICKSQLSKIKWKYIIIDEAHRIKNENSSLSQIMRVLSSENRLLVTGTPLQNNLHELWALLNFLLPDVFGNSEDFDEFFMGKKDTESNTVEEANKRQKLENGDKKENIKTEENGNEVAVRDNNKVNKDDAVIKIEDQDETVLQLQRVLEPFLLRRIKSEVEKSLLPKKEIYMYVGLTPMQKKWYRRILEKDIEAINGVLKKKEGKVRLLNIVMQLRKCCNHPYLFEGAEPGPPYTNDEHLVTNAGKMVILDKLLHQKKAAGSRVLIFSQMSRVLDILEDYCCMRDYEYCRIDGQTSHEDRIEAIDSYNKPESSKFIFLLTTRAGGLGINLTTADTVILFDSDWNPQVDLQAQDRAHRIGQTKQVYVYRFITENAVEEKVLERALQKLRLDQLVIQKAHQVQSTNAASRDELLSMVQFGAMDIVNDPEASAYADTKNTLNSNGKNEASNQDEIDLEAVMQKSVSKTSEIQSRYSTMGLDELVKFSGDTKSYQQQYMNGEQNDDSSVGNTDSNYNSNIVSGSNSPTSSKNTKGLNGALSSMLWIMPARRDRKINYAVDDYYKEALRVGGKPSSGLSEANKQPRMPKQPILNDFQFFPRRFYELLDKERLAFQKANNIVLKAKTTEEEESKEEKSARVAEQERIDEAEPLTEEEKAEKEWFIENCINKNTKGSAKFGFQNWSKRDYMSFIKLFEKYGDTDLTSVYNGLEGKTPAEFKSYHKVFLEKYEDELDDPERYKTAVQRGNARIGQIKSTKKLLEQFNSLLAKSANCKPKDFDYERHLQLMYSNPASRQDYKLVYSIQKGPKKFTEIEDCYLLLTLNNLDLFGDNLYEELRKVVRKSKLFRFNWFLKSRTSLELHRRCITLLALLNKQFNGVGNQQTQKILPAQKDNGTSKKRVHS